MNVFDLFAKISLDSTAYEKGLADSRKKADGFLSGLGSAFTKAGDFLLSTAKATAAAVGTVGTAIGGMTKQSLDAFANFEQLEGGTALMFGDAYDFIMEKSQQAYQTVQMSQNDYLTQVNGFAIGLKTALGGNEQAAAELADKIITAEADIVAATGNSQEAVQNAFNGIMKSNFTMLDNLKLGITPTKEGMQQVIDKVNEWNAAQGKATDYTLDNLADVQSALVDYVRMQGLSGYAANEASTTIQGSIAGMKAAWQNFLTGTGSAKQFTDMLGTVAGNIKPKIKEIVPRLTEGLGELVDLLAPEIPPLIEETLPTLIDASSNLLTKMAPRLPQILTTIAPSLIQGVVDVMGALGGVLPQIAPELVHLGTAAVTQIWNGMKSARNGENSESFVQAFTAELRTKLPYLERLGGDIVGQIAESLTEHAGEIGSGAIELLTKIGTKITDTEGNGKIIEIAGNIIGNLLDELTSQASLDKLFDTESGVPKIITNMTENIGRLGSKLVELAGKIMTNVSNYLSNEDNRKKVYKAAGEILKALGEGIVDLAEEIVPFIGEFAGRLAALLVDAVNDALTALFNPNGWKFGYYGSDVWQEEYQAADTSLTYRDWMAEKENQAAEDMIRDRYLYTSGGTYRPEGMAYYREDTIADFVARTGVQGVPAFGTGGIVTKPTFAMIGEDGAEAVVPLERDSEVGRMFGGVTVQFGDIYVTGGENAGREVVRQMDEALRIWQIQQARGIGGTAWT